MTEATLTQKPKRAPKSLEEEIAAQEDKLKKLKEQHRIELVKKKERNRKAVSDLIISEKLDLVAFELWKDNIEKIKSILIPTDNQVKPEQAVPTQSAE